LAAYPQTEFKWSFRRKRNKKEHKKKKKRVLQMFLIGSQSAESQEGEEITPFPFLPSGPFERYVTIIPFFSQATNAM
jgi:hypothetical protein